MSNKPEDENDPMKTSGQHGPREDTPGSAHQTDDNAQGQQAPAPAKMPNMGQMISDPAETVRRFINRNPAKLKDLRSDLRKGRYRNW